MTATTDTPVLDLLSKITTDSLEALEISSFDPKTFMLIRLAALVAVDAPPASYMLNLAAAGEAGLDEKSIRDVLIAVAPIVGTPHVVASIGNIGKALGIAIELAELEEATKS